MNDTAKTDHKITATENHQRSSSFWVFDRNSRTFRSIALYSQVLEVFVPAENICPGIERIGPRLAFVSRLLTVSLQEIEIHRSCGWLFDSMTISRILV